MKKSYKNVLFSVAANGISTITSIMVTLILPKIMPLNDYSYFQLFLFYVGYIGILHFGWADGFYIRICGKYYDSLDRIRVTGQFQLYSIVQLLLSCSISMWALTIPILEKKIVFLGIAVLVFLTNTRTLLLYILQATNRIKDYAHISMLGNLLYLVVSLLMCVMGVTTFLPFIMAYILGILISLIMAIRICRTLIFEKKIPDKIDFFESRENINIGVKLMIASVSSMLIIGIVRWGIENRWSIAMFGKISLTLSVSNLFMTFINAIATVLLPMLMREGRDKMREYYGIINILLLSVLFGGLVLCTPVQILLSNWLPQYTESLQYMTILFPICIFESKTSLMLNTYLKAIREEKAIMIINVGAVIISACGVYLFAFWFHNLEMMIFLIVFVLAVRCVLEEIYLSKVFLLDTKQSIVEELVLSIIFIVANWKIGGIMGNIIYILAYMLFINKNREKLKNSFSEIVRNYNKMS